MGGILAGSFILASEAAIEAGVGLWSINGIGAIIAIISSAAGAYFMIRKNRQEDRVSLRNYEKDVQLQMAGDIKKLRENSERYIILRKIIISETGVDHLAILQKLKDEYDLINGPAID